MNPKLADGLLAGFFRSAALILATTALLKTAGALAGHPVLDAPDPLFHWFSRRQLAGGAAVFEIILAVALWRMTSAHGRCFLVSWITAVFLAYRVGLWLIGYEGICPCLGATLDAWTGSALAEDRVASGLFVYLLVGSMTTAFILYRRGRRSPEMTAAPARGPLTLLVGLGLSWMAAATVFAATESLVVKGELKWFCPSGGPAGDPCVAWEFKAVVAPAAWSVRTTVTEGDEQGRHAFAYGETDFLVDLMQGPSGGPAHLLRAQSQLMEILHSRGLTNAALAEKVAMDSAAIVSNSDAPLYHPNGIPTVWLAFCSAAHLGGKDSSRVQPMFDMGAYRRSRYPVVGRTTYGDRTRRFPATVVFWNEGKVEDFDLDIQQGLPPFRPAPGPYAKGFTNSVYTAYLWTNVAGIKLPLRFSQVRLEPKLGGSSPDQLDVVWRYEGRVNSVEASSNLASMTPDFPVRLTAVMDQRIQRQYAGIQDARYQATNAAWLAESQLAGLPNVKPRTERVEMHRRWSPVGWLLVAAALLGFPAWAAWRSGRVSAGKIL